MQKRLFPGKERGHITFDWLDTYHSFSFGHFYNPDLMGFGALRVVNDDTIAPGTGFGEHSHQNMEIITLPLSGALEHKDNTGAHGITSAGSVQVMSAGKFVAHSEKNASETEPVTLFQIWIEPKVLGIDARYDEKAFPIERRRGKFQLLVSNDSREKSLMIHQDAFISLGRFERGETFMYTLREKKNGIFLMVVEGQAQIGEEELGRRDAIGISSIEKIEGKMLETGEILAIEVPLTQLRVTSNHSAL